MLLTTRARYAIMATVDLSKHAIDKPAKMADIAERQDISANYLEQILNVLKHAEIVDAVKGPGGGYKLKNSSDELYIADIIKAVAEPVKFTKCGETKPCSNKNAKCQTHALWKGLERNIVSYLSAISVSDVSQGKIANL